MVIVPIADLDHGHIVARLAVFAILDDLYLVVADHGQLIVHRDGDMVVAVAIGKVSGSVHADGD